MVKRSLTVSSHSSNPVPQIADLFNAILQKHSHFSGKFYVHWLSTLVGLGFTAILAEDSRVQLCKPCFATFLRYRDFTQHTDKLELLSHAIAEIICHAIYAFKSLGFPLYYDSFMLAFANLLKSQDSVNAESLKKIKKMMQELFEQCS
jgi:hypothetical protein